MRGASERYQPSAARTFDATKPQATGLGSSRFRPGACMQANARDAIVERRSADVQIDEPTGSFNSFYQAEYGRIVRLLYGPTGSWAVAEDIAQEALLAAHRRWHRVENLDRPISGFAGSR